MANALQCPKCGSQQVALQPVGTSDVLPTTTGSESLLIALDGNVECLSCGNVWKPVDQIEQALEDQAQADALDFDKRKESFYTEVEAGHLSQARRLVPKEARFIFKRSGLRATYTYLKSLDQELYKFKRTYWLIGVTVVLLVTGGLVYACS
ncbi:hypothetical protein [Spirosoma validum]|uniref:Uncharacterized protein n=1 Tax=Spirosoma validum TaxID=2771355 RepID=A0A927GDZ8_9BACT|nr:hypothetical protein [Spirosoma validum]MBD2754254.1 hypothetical protein [Spirosoma validum]